LVPKPSTLLPKSRGRHYSVVLHEIDRLVLVLHRRGELLLPSLPLKRDAYEVFLRDNLSAAAQKLIIIGSLGGIEFIGDPAAETPSTLPGAWIAARDDG
jgi:hypothetical protein